MRTNNLNCCCIWLHLHNVSSNVSAMYLDQIMHNPTGCIICLAFLHCGFSNGLPERMHSHIGCICLVFLHCESLNVSSVHLYQRIHFHSGCTCLNFLHCFFLLFHFVHWLFFYLTCDVRFFYPLPACYKLVLSLV